MKKFLPLLVVLLFILAYGIYFSALSIQTHRALLTHASDLGQIDQAIWNTLHGHWLETTRRDGTQLPRFTDHVEPIFIPLSLAFLIYDGVQALLVVQSFAIAIGALAVCWIARKKFTSPPPLHSLRSGTDALLRGEGGSWLAVGFAALYLLFPALEAANLAEFHAVTLAPAPLLFAYLYGSEKKWGRFALFAFLALMVKEEISLLVFMLSAYFAVADFRFSVFGFIKRPLTTWRAWVSAISHERSSIPRVPLAFTFLSLAWFVLTVFVIIPAFSPAGKSVYTCRYIVSEDCRAVVSGLFLNERVGYLIGLFAGVGFVALLDPFSLALGLPLLAANVLSNYPAQYSGTFHYSAPVAPYLILAAIGGMARWLKWMPSRFSSSLLRVSVPALVFVIALAYHLLAGYTPVGGAFVSPSIDAHDELLTRFTNQIPRDAIVSATPALHPHLSHRQFIYRFSTALDTATYSQRGIEYVMLDVSESVTANPIDFRVQYDGLLKQGYGVVDASDGYILLQRGRAGPLGAFLPSEFYSYFRAQGDPQIRAAVDFGDAIRFLGYDVLNDLYGRVTLRLYWKRLRAVDKNYYLVPFYADANDQPRMDVDLPPMTVLFWYPTSAWQANDIVVAQTLSVDVGAEARIGLSVVEGNDFANVDSRLTVRVNSPAPWKTFDQNTWVDVGAVEKKGTKYQVVSSK